MTADPEILARRAGRAARDHQRARPGSGRTRSSTRCGRATRAAAATTTTSSPARPAPPRPGEIRRRLVPLPRAERVPRAARRRRAAGGQRGPRQLVRDAPRRGRATRWPAGRDVILKIDVQGARVVKERVPDALLDLHRPAVARGAVPAPPVAGDRDGRRARAPPAQRRHRAGPPGRLRPGGRERDRRGGPDRRRDRGDHRPGEAPQRGPADPHRLTRRPHARPRAVEAPATAVPVPRRRRGRSSRSRSTPPAAPGRAPTPTCVPAALGDLEPGEAVLVPFGGRPAGDRGRPRRRAAPPAAASSCGPIAARVRSDGPLLPPLRSPSPRGLGDRYLAPLAVGDPGDAPAGHARAARARGGGDAGRRGARSAAELDPGRTSTCSTSSPGGPRPCATSSSPDGRAGLLRRLRALADLGLLELDLDAARGRRRAALRAAPVADGRRARPPRRRSRRGEQPPGRPLGPRQQAALAELAGDGGADAVARRGRRRPARGAPRILGPRRPRPTRPPARRGPRAAAPAARRPPGRSRGARPPAPR